MEDKKKNITVSTNNEQFRLGSDPEGSSRNQEYAERLAKRRTKLGYTQQIISDLTGIGLKTIQNYESGAWPKGDYAIALSKALKCSLDWLLLGEGPEPPDPGEEKQETENALYNKVEMPPPKKEDRGYLDDDPRVADLLEVARLVLKSGNEVAFDALERNIRYFYHAIKSEKYLQGVESRISNMEGDISQIKKLLVNFTQARKEENDENPITKKEGADKDAEDTGITVKAAGDKS